MIEKRNRTPTGFIQPSFKESKPHIRGPNVAGSGGQSQIKKDGVLMVHFRG